MPDQPHQCPLCGDDNRCTASTNSHDAPCWCMHQQVDSERLKRAQPQLANQQCLCRQCLAPYLRQAERNIESNSNNITANNLGSDIMAPSGVAKKKATT